MLITPRPERLQTYEYIMSVALPAATRAFGQLIDKVTIIVDLGTWGLMDMPKASPLILSLHFTKCPPVAWQQHIFPFSYDSFRSKIF